MMYAIVKEKGGRGHSKTYYFEVSLISFACPLPP